MIWRLFGNKNKRHVTPEIKNQLKSLAQNEIPAHIAIIMDGNGRWAKKRALPRVAGHHEGMQTVKRITRVANELGVKVLTLYAFSTENWNRPKQEVDTLMRLPSEFLQTFLPELIENNVKVEMIGDPSQLPQHTLTAIQNAQRQTAHNTGLILNFAMNYGSRLEMVKATQQIAEKVQQGQLELSAIDEKCLTAHLMTHDLPDPDLLIRTSGEMRLSNFMLWQLAYSEFIFMDVLWPDFEAHHFIAAIEAYQSRSRRFGALEGGKTK